MSDPIITVENLSKRYRLGQIGMSSLRESAERFFQRFRRSPSTNDNQQPVPRFNKQLNNQQPATDSSDFWALRDVSFEVKRGEVLGVVGRNGAGKSTVLKILSRITEPTSGRAILRGRVASLLEVGTGFHPELTGRENIFLNGAILGMRKAEIATKFDEIVAFSEIEKFIDTPVKRYSSGMYVRLAFAVAAHLDPEILLVDEVLAVGDASFQKKCLGKMGEVARGGRTVLFVSHNMSAVLDLCHKAILLVSGQVDLIANVNEVINKYSLHTVSGSSADLTVLEHAQRPQAYGVLTRLSIFDATGKPTTTFLMGQPIVARLGVHIHRKMQNAEMGFKISSRMGITIHYFCSTWEGLRQDLVPGDYLFEIYVPRIMLLPAKYILGAWLAQEKGAMADDIVNDISIIEVIGNDFTGTAADFARKSISGCEVYAPSEWRIIQRNKEE